jgi:NDP-sugar pyrophosphorylase family protein
MKNTKIIILCGGKGSRLGKLTENIPKPLVKIGMYSILENKLNYYKQQGWHNFIFCTGYKGEKIKKKVIELGINGKFSNIGENPGILERIYKVKNSFNGPSIISYGDTYAEIDLNDLLIDHKKSKTLLTLVVAPIKNPFGLLDMDENSRVIKFREKPILNHYIGYAVIQPEMFDKIPKSIINLPDGLGIIKAVNFLSKLRQVNAYQFGGLQVTVNTAEELKTATEKIGKYFTVKESNEK